MPSLFVLTTILIPLLTAVVCAVFAVFQLKATFGVFKQNLSSQITNLIFNILSFFLMLYGIAWGVSKAGSAGCFLIDGVGAQDSVFLHGAVSLVTATATAALVINFAAGLNFLNYLSNNRFLYFNDWRETYKLHPGLGNIEMFLRGTIACCFFFLTAIIGASDFDISKAVFEVGRVEFSFVANAYNWMAGSSDAVRSCAELDRLIDSERVDYATKQFNPIGKVAALSLILYSALAIWVVVNSHAMLLACENGGIVDCRNEVKKHRKTHLFLAFSGISTSSLIAVMFNFGDVRFSQFFFNVLDSSELFKLGGLAVLALICAVFLMASILLKPLYERRIRKSHASCLSLKVSDPEGNNA